MVGRVIGGALHRHLPSTPPEGVELSEPSRKLFDTNPSMTTTLGKRKRKSVNDATAVTSDGDQPVQENDAQAVFRQYFEQQFRPIENSTKPTTIVTEDPVAVAEEDSDWDGLSEPEGKRLHSGMRTEAEIVQGFIPFKSKSTMSLPDPKRPAFHGKS